MRWPRTGDRVPIPAGEPSKVVVPDFVGMAVSECWHLAGQSGVRFEVERVIEGGLEGDGMVVGQTPAAGAKVEWGTRITLEAVHRRSASPKNITGMFHRSRRT